MGEISLTRIIKPRNISKVAVLHGGTSEEKEVSNSTAESCIEASIQLSAVELDTSFSSEVPPCNTATLEIFLGLIILVKLISPNSYYLPIKHDLVFLMN